jgi:hypothetical protein
LQKDKIIIEPHPEKVLIKTSMQDYEALFYKWITRDDGSKVKLFTQIEAAEGFESRFQQNLSTGTIVAIGSNVKGIQLGDLAILDYLVSSDSESYVGTVNGDRMVSLQAKTTYHETSALPSINMRRAFVKGDYDVLSKILGVIRDEKLISFTPYIFLTKEDSKIVKVNAAGMMYEVVEMWNWILEEGLEDFTDYAQYGLPLFKATAVKYGFDNPIGDDDGDEFQYSAEYDEY